MDEIREDENVNTNKISTTVNNMVNDFDDTAEHTLKNIYDMKNRFWALNLLYNDCTVSQLTKSDLFTLTYLLDELTDLLYEMNDLKDVMTEYAQKTMHTIIRSSLNKIDSDNE